MGFYINNIDLKETQLFIVFIELLTQRIQEFNEIIVSKLWNYGWVITEKIYTWARIIVYFSHAARVAAENEKFIQTSSFNKASPRIQYRTGRARESEREKEINLITLVTRGFMPCWLLLVFGSSSFYLSKPRWISWSTRYISYRKELGNQKLWKLS